jgi:anaerobic magnesium-protoporphyrin IX monomethyl ester cyclase
MKGGAASLRVLLVQHGPGPGELASNIDAVMARCSGIWSKADYAMPPVGLQSCATVLEREIPGCRCELLDLACERLHGADASAAMEAVGADVLVHTPGSASLARDLELCGRWQRGGPGRWVVSLGTHATIEPDSVLPAERWAVVRGEPERRLVKLCQALTEGAEAGRLAALPGVLLRLGGRIARGPEDDSLVDPAWLPVPDRRWLRRYRYRPPFARPGPFQLVLCSRGCPHGCHFCASQAFYGRRFRQRGVASVLEEVEGWARDGVRTVGFWDDSFTVDRAWVLELCARLERSPWRPGWICMSRTEAVDTELIDAMARAGCYQIQYGVESATPELLARLGKPTDLARVRRAFALTRRAGLETAGFFMLGLPGETAAQRRATVRLALELDPTYVSFNLFTPLPGTPVYGLAEAADAQAWARMDGSRAAGPAARALEAELARAYLRFYARPRYLVRQLAALRSPERALTLGRAGLAVLRTSLGKLGAR